LQWWPNKLPQCPVSPVRKEKKNPRIPKNWSNADEREGRHLYAPGVPRPYNNYILLIGALPTGAMNGRRRNHWSFLLLLFVVPLLDSAFYHHTTFVNHHHNRPSMRKRVGATMVFDKFSVPRDVREELNVVSFSIDTVISTVSDPH